MTHRWILCLGVSLSFAATPPNVQEIVQKSVGNTEVNWNSAPQFDFMERDITTKKGRVEKTYRVTMIEGSPYNQLVAINGTPLTGSQAAQEERKLQQETTRRKHETTEQKQQRIAQYAGERRQDQALLREMVHAFDFRLKGEETINGRRCFVLESTPKAGYRPTSRETKVLTGMRGKMWVDEQELQWVKVEAEVFRPVAFGLFLAHVEPGTRFTLEQKPVQRNLWLPSHFSMQVNARVLRYLPHNSTEDETYWNYRHHAQSTQASTGGKR